ncbi:hypothetical protein CIK05_00560 [Bdellovibrio sp. qaytius]|nr:hypothetical protein CIK05_00560 [Bdellovibrio sp. qaytius]
MSITFQLADFTARKAAQVAAFFILAITSGFTQPVWGAVSNKPPVLKSQIKTQEQRIDEAKKKITTLMLLKQRPQALELIQNINRTNSTPELQKKISQLKLVVLTSFLSSEAQDFFELASSQYLTQAKSSLKNTQKCLSIDPEQFMCLWAEVKANGKNNSRYAQFLEKMKLTALDVPELKPLILSLDKTQTDFINLQLDSNSKTELYDSQLLAAILEFDRSILAKNYLLAKESLDKLTQLAPDYIDVILMRAQLYRHTYGEDAENNLVNVVTIYKKKCEAVSPEIARKYFFDIDFCRRTLE